MLTGMTSFGIPWLTRTQPTTKKEYGQQTKMTEFLVPKHYHQQCTSATRKDCLTKEILQWMESIFNMSLIGNKFATKCLIPLLILIK